jgi:hypothetical protein
MMLMNDGSFKGFNLFQSFSASSKLLVFLKASWLLQSFLACLKFLDFFKVSWLFQSFLASSKLLGFFKAFPELFSKLGFQSL